MVVSEKPSKNGHTPQYVEDLSQLPQRRTELVDVSLDEDEPRYVLMRAMNGGEKRRFQARDTKPDPDNHLERTLDLDWRNGEKGRALIALCAVKQNGEPLFPEARDRALRIIAVPDGEDWMLRVGGDPDPNHIDDIDVAVQELLVDAADRLSLLSVAAWQVFANSPLAQRNRGFYDGALALAYRTPRAPGTP